MRHGELYINDQLVPRRPFGEYLYEEGPSVVVLKQYLEALPRGSGDAAERTPDHQGRQ